MKKNKQAEINEFHALVDQYSSRVAMDIAKHLINSPYEESGWKEFLSSEKQISDYLDLHLTFDRVELCNFLKTAEFSDNSIFYNGKWLHLCRSDLRLDCPTGYVYPFIEPTEEKYKQEIIEKSKWIFGAIADDVNFMFIDSLTDG